MKNVGGIFVLLWLLRKFIDVEVREFVIGVFWNLFLCDVVKMIIIWDVFLILINIVIVLYFGWNNFFFDDDYKIKF